MKRAAAASYTSHRLIFGRLILQETELATVMELIWPPVVRLARGPGAH